MIANINLRELSELLKAVNTGGLRMLALVPLDVFIRAHLKAAKIPDFSAIAKLLADCHRYRAGCAHYQDAESRYEEQANLEQLRNLVLGIPPQQSILQSIYETLAKK